MTKIKEITGHKVAGLIADLMQKMRNNQVSVMQLENFLQMNFAQREEKFGRIANPWFPQMEKIAHFRKEVFGKETNWDTVTLPVYSEEFNTLEYIDPSISGKELVSAYKHLFKDESVYGNDYSKDIDAKTKEQQERPVSPYCIAHRGGIECDEIHRNKSYDDFCNDGNQYMVPREGITFALRYRFETKNMIDVKGITRFHALDSDGIVLCMNRDGDGQFYLDWYNRDGRYSDRGPRQVNF